MASLLVDLLFMAAVKSLGNTVAGHGISAVASNWRRGPTQLLASVVLTLVGVEKFVVVDMNVDVDVEG
jgi:hypothetical protein